MNIENYTKTELSEISKVLKKYRTLRTNVGKKSGNLMHQDLSGENKVVIEYFPTLSKDEMINTTISIYQNIFGVKVNSEKITWKENTSIAGGMRLFFGDDMLDISFESMRNSLRKI